MIDSNEINIVVNIKLVNVRNNEITEFIPDVKTSL